MKKQSEKREWIQDFKAAARRSLRERLNYAFIHTYKPVLDDKPFRAFETMKEYRKWCEENLPPWLGYGKTTKKNKKKSKSKLSSAP